MSLRRNNCFAFKKCGTWQPCILQLTANIRVIDRSCRSIPLPARFNPKSFNECVLVKFECSVNIMSYLVWQRVVVQTNTRASDKSACSIPSFCIVQNVVLVSVERFSKIYFTIKHLAVVTLPSQKFARPPSCYFWFRKLKLQLGVFFRGIKSARFSECRSCSSEITIL